MPQTLREHKALFDAIRHQDGDAAEQAALTMIASSTRKVKGNHMTARYIAIDWGSTNLRAGFIRATTARQQAIRSRRHAPERKISGCGVSRSDDRLA